MLTRCWTHEPSHFSLKFGVLPGRQFHCPVNNRLFEQSTSLLLSIVGRYFNFRNGIVRLDNEEVVIN